MNRKILTGAKVVKQMFTRNEELFLWKVWKIALTRTQNHNSYKRGEEGLMKGKTFIKFI